MRAGLAALLLVALTGCAGHDDAGSARPDGADAVSHAPGLVRPGHVDLGGSTVAEARPVVRTAQELYTFWDSGDVRWLHRAVAPSFRDRTLPTGRPQGRTGPAVASQQFRAAVPDLTCRLERVWVSGDTFTAKLLFSGHFTGVSGGVHGKGQAVRFDAIDVQHVGPGGRITEDWHLEDNLTFEQQAGLLAAG